jgi:hypothetical protein
MPPPPDWLGAQVAAAVAAEPVNQVKAYDLQKKRDMVR